LKEFSHWVKEYKKLSEFSEDKDISEFYKKDFDTSRLEKDIAKFRTQMEWAKRSNNTTRLEILQSKIDKIEEQIKEAKTERKDTSHQKDLKNESDIEL